MGLQTSEWAVVATCPILPREDAEKAISELKHIGGRQVSVSMATKRQRKRKRGKVATAEDQQVDSSLHAKEEHGSVRGEDVDSGSDLGERPLSCIASTRSMLPVSACTYCCRREVGDSCVCVYYTHSIGLFTVYKFQGELHICMWNGFFQECPCLYG